jgi:hypothetical protein
MRQFPTPMYPSALPFEPQAVGTRRLRLSNFLLGFSADSTLLRRRFPPALFSPLGAARPNRRYNDID